MDSMNFVKGMPFKALEYGVMFAVDGQYPDVLGAGAFHDERPGHDHRFLVGERHTVARIDGIQDRHKAGRADDRAEDEVAWVRGEFGDGLRSLEYRGAAEGPGVHRGIRSAHGDELGIELVGLDREERGV